MVTTCRAPRFAAVNSHATSKTRRTGAVAPPLRLWAIAAWRARSESDSGGPTASSAATTASVNAVSGSRAMAWFCRSIAAAAFGLTVGRSGRRIAARVSLYPSHAVSRVRTGRSAAGRSGVAAAGVAVMGPTGRGRMVRMT